MLNSTATSLWATVLLSGNASLLNVADVAIIRAVSALPGGEFIGWSSYSGAAEVQSYVARLLEDTTGVQVRSANVHEDGPLTVEWVLWHCSTCSISQGADTVIYDVYGRVKEVNAVRWHASGAAGASLRGGAPGSPRSYRGDWNYVWNNHADTFALQRVNGILEDYDERSVLIFFDGESVTLFKGLAGVRQFFEDVFAQLSSVLLFAPRVVQLDQAQCLLVWECRSSGIRFASDTFVFDANGRILIQTVVANLGVAEAVGWEMAIAVLIRVAGTLSLLGSLAIVLTWLARRPFKVGALSRRILFYMSATDVVGSFAYFLGPWPSPAGTLSAAAGTEATCSLQGWLLQINLAVPLWNACLAHHMFLVLFYRELDAPKRSLLYEPYYMAVAWGFPFVTSFVALGLKLYGFTVTWCWIPLVTNITRNVLPWTFFFIPLWSAILVASGLMVAIACRVQQTAAGAGESSAFTKSAAKLLRREAMWYTFVFLLTWTCKTMFLVRRTAFPETVPAPALVASYAFFVPLQGFLNAAVYFLVRDLRWTIDGARRLLTRRAKPVSLDLDRTSQLQLSKNNLVPASTRGARLSRISASSLASCDECALEPRASATATELGVVYEAAGEQSHAATYPDSTY